MKTDSTISGSEMLLTVIAIRLAVLVLVGWSLLLLPRQAHESVPACTAALATTATSNAAGSQHVSDAAFDDMLLHD
ncbi:hypothetical protein [Bradyrhizobium sp. Cp5.3]|uniref:hypothetical protein n=1 Tax=Bradyrhizobium sp. Cp5.3 TaxID=443598 RepID=UPI00048A31B9|nr:hypothetical protein [Bradyrhizobium sp. Cp5.3]